MSDIAIRVQNLGKQYHIGALQKNGGGHSYKSLRDSIASAASAPFRAARSLISPNGSHLNHQEDTIWALKDVSFDVKQGEIVGVIGRNGAGKSTLLKLLSRITEPTTGRVEIHGRVGSLLEVGTGFHPELSGRDNVYLNGAILGMKKAEIEKNFDAIVSFAEVERFIDTPVKHYSSGMYLRLAFAVAAHLQTEVLIVDEVLAVGDAEFQKKCLGKMKEVSHGGRTVIFVSHNIAAIRALCSSGMLLDKGTMTLYDQIQPVSDAYVASSAGYSDDEPSVILSQAPDRCDVWVESASVLCNGRPSTKFEFGDRLGFKVNFKARAAIRRPLLGYLIRSSQGQDAVNANNYFLPSPDYESPVTEGTIICDLGELPLMAGTYLVSFWLGNNPHEQHHVEDVLHFRVEEKDIWVWQASAKVNIRPLVADGICVSGPRRAMTSTYAEGLERLGNYSTSLDDRSYLVYRGLFPALEKASVKASGRLLDIGCGNKPYEGMFEGRITEYIGCDVAQSNGNRVDIICPANKIPMEDASFDTVLCTQVIEHVPDHRSLIREAYRLLKGGGAFILSGPMYWPLHEEPFDFFRFTKYGFRHVLEEAGFAVETVECNGGKWALCGLVLIHTIERSRLDRRPIIRLINRVFAHMDDRRFDPISTINYLVVAHKP